jgi:hypothetical protein
LEGIFDSNFSVRFAALFVVINNLLVLSQGVIVIETETEPFIFGKGSFLFVLLLIEKRLVFFELKKFVDVAFPLVFHLSY